MLVCLYALRGFTRPSYISGGGGGWGWQRETQALTAFMNLELALEADAWVCALSSNWCRLIDELRMTVGMKASKPYLSMSRSGGKRQPCTPEKPQCYLRDL